jgi:4-amino-4-deoxy-L-arabinose transferase-like glycosyltransferase
MTFRALVKKIPPLVWAAIGLSLVINSHLFYIFIVQGNANDLVVGDGLGYLELGKNIIEGRGFTQTIGGEIVFETFRTPGLPLIVGLFAPFEFGLALYFTILALGASVLFPILIWLLGRRFFNDTAAIIAVWLFALEPLVYFHTWQLLTEVPFLLFFISAATILVYRSSPAALIFSSILLACAVYIRPGALLLVIALLSLGLGYSFYYKNKTQTKKLALIFGLFFVLLLPWHIKIYQHTGEFSFSGTGWRNVYTDYVASIRSINNGTSFADEKNKLKAYAEERWLISRAEINSPAMSDELKVYALNEIVQYPGVVLKLQAILFVSYFTHTDYLARAERMGIVPSTNDTNRISISHTVLTQGFGAYDDVYNALKKRYFIPVLERAWSTSLFLFFIVGLIASIKKPQTLLIAAFIGMGYLTSSAIGLGVEGRLRLPILPFYLLLSAVGIILSYRTMLKIYHRPFLKLSYEKKS